jgi:predicted transcriptional regulator
MKGYQYMPGSPSSQTSRVFTVRLDPALRESLDALATTSDRSLAQLSRYALRDFPARHDGPALPPDPDAGAASSHMTLRLPAALAVFVDEQAQQRTITPSEVIRQALSSWVATADISLLGTPSHAGETP